ncbi:carboxypeptidase-like regulatory domain-containing protein, partial [bacterium]|nr:carboxypeptidase-like regulatory domain-containing protein [bacterium]
MKHCIVCVLLLLTATLSYGVSVTGVALLENETNHSGIEVKFEAVSPSAEMDSVYTNSSGNFSIMLEPGVYNILYSHEGFFDHEITSLGLTMNMELETVVLDVIEAEIGGEISGTIGPGTYLIG